jgi:hypothetical protein
MATLGLYCKAYYVSDLAKFPGWAPSASTAKKERQDVNGNEVETERQLRDTDYLFLHDTLVVTDGLFTDELVVFDRVTPEWQAFCRDVLRFEIPEGCAADVAQAAADAPAGVSAQGV